MPSRLPTPTVPYINSSSRAWNRLGAHFLLQDFLFLILCFDLSWKQVGRVLLRLLPPPSESENSSLLGNYSLSRNRLGGNEWDIPVREQILSLNKQCFSARSIKDTGKGTWTLNYPYRYEHWGSQQLGSLDKGLWSREAKAPEVLGLT